MCRGNQGFELPEREITAENSGRSPSQLQESRESDKWHQGGRGQSPFESGGQHALGKQEVIGDGITEPEDSGEALHAEADLPGSRLRKTVQDPIAAQD